MQIFWEKIESNHDSTGSYYSSCFRARIFGGWLVKTSMNTKYIESFQSSTATASGYENTRGEDIEMSGGLGLTFVPDVNGDWKL